MKSTATKLVLGAVLALAVSAPAFAQQANWSQQGDYYAPSKTIVQQPTVQELRQAEEGDFYAPSKTVVQQPSAQQLKQFREGDFYNE